MGIVAPERLLRVFIKKHRGKIRLRIEVGGENGNAWAP